MMSRDRLNNIDDRILIKHKLVFNLHWKLKDCWTLLWNNIYIVLTIFI